MKSTCHRLPTHGLVMLTLALARFSATTAQAAAAPTNATHEAEELVVIAAPLSAPLDTFGRAAWRVALDTPAGLALLDLSDALEQGALVHVSERGAHAVQADVSMRGSTYEQVLVTVDGLPLADPRTGHNNMDLPFPACAIDAITVIGGPGSALFGPTALAGSVHVRTRVPHEPGAMFSAVHGSFDTWGAQGRIDSAWKNTAGSIAAAYADSDGFMDGTDYETRSFWGTERLTFEKGSLNLRAGYTHKDFGARNFYAQYPSREETSATLLDLAPEFELGGGWRLSAGARYRRHDDTFILIEDDPDFYQNRHRAEAYLERVVVHTPASRWGTLAASVERSDAFLHSSNLGDRESAVSSAFVQHRYASPGRWFTDFGLRADAHDDWGNEVSPNLAAGVFVHEDLRLHAAVGSGFRPPSFTDLYYDDPAHIGNPELEPETAWGAEVGFQLALATRTRVTGTGFLRQANDLIDWVRASEDERWQATNIGETTTSGGELSIETRIGQVACRAAYRYTGIQASEQDLESKYALNVARHDALLELRLPEFKKFSASAGARYRDVPTLDSYWLVNACIKAHHIPHATLFVRGANLLDQEYSEIPDVATAGRYVEGGVELNW